MAERMGQQLGNYRLIRLIGQGGFADVYLGRHIHLNTQAAIKILQMRLIGSDLQLFHNEARTIANLVHPHIVRILDFDIEDSTGTPYLVMDYAANGTLRQRHPRGTPVPVANILHYVKHVASALQYAHDRKLIHRDVKPENMLLGQNNEVYLSDFGLVLEAQSSSSRSIKEMAGTASYMAPEQFQGKPRSTSDQYALGVAVYEWLSGDRPFHGAFKEIASQHMFVPPPPLYGKVPEVTPALEEVVQRALSKEPVQRFATVQDFANALEHAYYMAQPTPLTPPHIVTSPIQTSQPFVVKPHLDEPVQFTYMVTPPSQTSQPTSLKLSMNEPEQSDYIISLPSQTSQPTAIKTPSDESLQSTRIVPPSQTPQSTIVRPLQDTSTQSTYVPTPPIQIPRPTVVLPTQSTSLQLPISANPADQSSSVTPVVSPAGKQQLRKKVISWRTVVICLAGLAIIASTVLLVFLPLPAHTDTPTHTPTSVPSPTATPTHRPSPTATPTSTPSPNPTSPPIVNPGSTPTPTAIPTPTPTAIPTPTPTFTPTPKPTQVPTPTATLIP